MATRAEWIEGARLRTLFTGAAPVVAGTAIAVWEQSFRPVNALLCLVVALAMQVGANYANDYSDGIRGSDDQHRVGPQRLVGSGAATAQAVRRAAVGSFVVACLAGLGLVVITGHWWLVGVGIACVLAAWFYTGGSNPYGYRGLGEVFDFIFFGLVAVCGTTYVQADRVTLASVFAGISMGVLSMAILTCNNLRDIDGDRLVGKMTLATRLGDHATRRVFALYCAIALLGFFAVSGLTSWWALLGLVALTRLVPAARLVLDGTRGMPLVKAIKYVGQGQLLGALGMLVGLAGSMQ